MTADEWYHWDGPDLVLKLKMQPKASRDAFAEHQNDRQRVRITVPPAKGRANAHLIAWLARQFGVAKSAVAIESSHSSALQRVRVRAQMRLPDVMQASQTS